MCIRDSDRAFARDGPALSVTPTNHHRRRWWSTIPCSWSPVQRARSMRTIGSLLLRKWRVRFPTPPGRNERTRRAGWGPPRPGDRRRRGRPDDRRRPGARGRPRRHGVSPPAAQGWVPNAPVARWGGAGGIKEPARDGAGGRRRPRWPLRVTPPRHAWPARCAYVTSTTQWLAPAHTARTSRPVAQTTRGR